MLQNAPSRKMRNFQKYYDHQIVQEKHCTNNLIAALIKMYV